MVESFVPLLPVATPTGESKPSSYRLKVMPSTQTSESFKPIEPRPAVPPATIPHACAPTSVANARPIVTLEREGDQVTHIRIQCACGQVIEIECEY
jgi:hypothetical protein